MTSRHTMSQEALDELKKRYEYLTTIHRNEVVQQVARAREEGDLRENAGYHAARERLGHIDGEIAELQERIRYADIVDPNAVRSTSIVEMYSTVTLDIDGAKRVYTIVGSVEANPRENKVSSQSPIGTALLGQRVGSTVLINAPQRQLQARIVSIE